MPKITFLPDKKDTSVTSGTTIHEAAILAGIVIDVPCGAQGKCGKCRVLISKNAPLSTALEEKLIPAKDLKKGIRLACQTKIQQITDH